MKLLLLTKKFPYPLTDGESVAVHNMVVELDRLGITVDILSFNTSKHYTDLARYSEELRCYSAIYTTDINNEISKMAALKNLFSRRSFHIERYDNEQFKRQLSDLLNTGKYDVVQMESIFMAPYIDTVRLSSNTKLILRTHNIEYRIWQRILTQEKGLKKLYLQEQVKRLTKYERSVWSRFDQVIAMSDVDAEEIKKHSSVNIKTIPICLDAEQYHSKNSSINELCFIGSLDWMPNTEGIDWFFNEIWQKVVAKTNTIRLNIAGKNAPLRYENIQTKGIVFHGMVDSAIDFIDRYNIMIVPLKSGSGIRVKILEAMALGKVVISTSVGIEGIMAIPEKDYILADTAEAFAEAIQRVVNDKTLQESISRNAKALFDRRYSNTVNGADFFKIYNELQ